MPLLTVFTPTYNRISELHRLYDSLVCQTSYEFEWLVVDDGSNDGTYQQLEKWSKVSPFQLRFYQQDNAGKHVAHNLGAQAAHGQFFICLDSDDWFEPDAIQTIISDIDGLAPDEGLIYPKLFAGQPKVENWLPAGKYILLSDMRMRYGMVVETAIVFSISSLRRHPFPRIGKERYMPEDSAYYDFVGSERFRVCDALFYRCQYHEEGLTNNIYNNWLSNPRGTKLALAKRYETACKYRGQHAVKGKISALVGIESLNLALGESPYDGVPEVGFAALACLPLSLVISHLRYGSEKRG